MCGIYGIGLLDDHVVDNNTLGILATRLAKASQIRGGDATGMSFATMNDGIKLIKTNEKAKTFVELKEYVDLIGKLFPTNTKTNGSLRSMIGHCRAQTQGTHTNNLNNHPILIENIIGVHNGHIHNDHQLYAQFKDRFNRKAQVDSEIIFSLINYFSSLESPNENNPVVESIKRAAKLMSGNFACAVMDARNTDCLWLFRNNNPIEIRFFKKEGMIVFASSLLILQEALEPTTLSDPSIVTVDSNSGICINLHTHVKEEFKL